MKQLSEILSSLYDVNNITELESITNNVQTIIDKVDDKNIIKEDDKDNELDNVLQDSDEEDVNTSDDLLNTNETDNTDNTENQEDNNTDDSNEHKDQENDTEENVPATSEDDEENDDNKTDDNNYFFKNIIFFTNEREASKNKTLKNLKEAIKGKDIELITFVAKEIEYKSTDKYIEIQDSENKYKVEEQSNIDTIVIVRLGALESEECMECIQELQDWGLFVLNPIQAACKASNKYASSILMDRYNIPQPKFALLTAKDVKNGQDSLNKKLKKIYKSDLVEDEKESKNLEYVIKILDGHGGTGVFMVNGKTILAVLQAIFAIDPDRELLLQKKEEADGGDIRVHVLTSRTKLVILASMKRVKISGDFRSNVSLGATAEKVELTDEQKEIALNVAKISGMPWCAVDIMPLVKDSNPEVGDNVVLEYNASPGTEGISEVIGENFCKILLDAINDINELVLSPKTVGYIEKIIFKIGDNEFTKIAKLDTGNGAHASTLGCDKIETTEDEIIATIDEKEYRFKKHGLSNATVGLVVETRNTVIMPYIQIGARKLLDVEFALVDNRNKSTKVLLNRDVLSKLAYTINPAKKYILDEFFRSSDYKKHNK